MKKQKMNLAAIQGKLSRVEMKSILAGDADGRLAGCLTGSCMLVVQHPPDTPLGSTSYVTYHGSCASSGSGCYCNTAYYNTNGPLISNGGISRCTA